jgi:tryptophan halogenase
MKNLTIVGGGTAGWMAAAWFSKFNKNLKITVIESPNVPKIGVGESVTPHVAAFFKKIGLNELDLMKQTNAVYKYANKFINWNKNNHYEYSSFTYPMDSSLLLKDVTHGTEFSEFITKEIGTADTFMHLLAEGKINKFDEYFHSQYFYVEKNVAPFDKNDYLLNRYYSWSYHINGELTAEFIRDNIAIPNGVKHIKADVTDIIKNQNKIETLILDNGSVNQADFYVDATGFKRLLASKLNWKFKEYKNHSVKSVFVAQTEYVDIENELVNYSQSIAEPVGWRFKSGLYHRMGNGYCYSPDYISDNTACEYFIKKIKNPINNPKKITWIPGRYETPLQENVATIGLSIGFIEALEATSLLTIVDSIEELSKVFNNKSSVVEFNNRITKKFDIIADFILVHYTLSNRDDTEFWKDMQELGRKENHADLVYEYFKTLKFGQNSAFPDFMWGQIAHSWGLNLDRWLLDNKYKDLIDLTYIHYSSTKEKHNIISNSRMSNYEWLKTYIYN